MGGIELRSASGSETRTHTSGTALRPLTYTSTATYGPYKTTQHRGHWVTQGTARTLGPENYGSVGIWGSGYQRSLRVYESDAYNF